MANFKFIYPDIGSKTRLAATTAAGQTSADNLEIGPRRKYWKGASAATSCQFDYDYGSGVTKQPTHLVIADAHLARIRDSAAITVSLIGDSSSGFATTPETETDTYDLTDLVGPDEHDFVLECSFATAFRYFRAKIESTDSITHEMSKLYFCEAFDLDREPVYTAQSEIMPTALHTKSARLAYYLKFEGITDTKKAAWMSTIDPIIDVSPIFVYDSADYLFDGRKLLHCIITRADWSEVEQYGQNNLDLVLEQVI